VDWLWDGFLARGSLTLLSALPKCGKTTLLAHLLRALAAGGSFAGRSLMPGRAVVVTEEGTDVWRQRRDQLGISDRVELISRPFFGKPTAEVWLSFLRHLLAHAADADLVVLDTIANLWPVRDENGAADVQAALMPLQRLADGRAVLLSHHLRKSDGREGTASRGSGALAGFVDIILELRRSGDSRDATGRQRVLTGIGRHPGIPQEWLIGLTEDGEYAAYADGQVRRPMPDGRGLREAIRDVLPADPPGLTRKQIWEALPEEFHVNEHRFRSVLQEGVGDWWIKKSRSNVLGGPTYWIRGDDGIDGILME
jgi:AAA domain